MKDDRKSIKISKELHAQLEKMKIIPREPFDSVIKRLLKEKN